MNAKFMIICVFLFPLRFFGSRPVTSFERRMGPRNRYFRRFSSAENAGNSRKYKFAPSTTILSSPRHSIGLFRGKRLVHAKGFGAADDDQDEHSRNVRTMTTGELRAEIESFGLGSEDCEDRLDLERKLKAVRRGTYKEGKIKTAEDAGGYLKSQRTSSSGPAIEDISGISSQENKAAAFDQALQQTSVQSQQAQAESFDAAIQDRLDSVTSISSMAKKGQKVFDLLEYPCEHEIKIVGAKASEIEMRVRSIVGDTTGTDPEVLKTSSREKGKWISISVMAPVSSSEMLYDIYARLNSEERFRYVM